MQALLQRVDVNTCWITRRRNTTEPNRRQVFPPPGKSRLQAASTIRQREALRFRNKAKVFGCKRKAGGFDLIFVNVRHFVTADGEIYSGLCGI